MPTESNERAIGRIEGKLDLIIAEQQASALSRKLSYERMDHIERKVDTVDQKVDRVDQRLDAVEAPVAEFSKWKERAVGAVMLVSFTAASTGAIVATFGRKIWAGLTS